MVGGRESWWDQDTPATRFKPGRQFTPYGGLIWDFARDWSWYVSYAEVSPAAGGSPEPGTASR